MSKFIKLNRNNDILISSFEHIDNSDLNNPDWFIYKLLNQNNITDSNIICDGYEHRNNYMKTVIDIRQNNQLKLINSEISVSMLKCFYSPICYNTTIYQGVNWNTHRNIGFIFNVSFLRSTLVKLLCDKLRKS